MKILFAITLAMFCLFFSCSPKSDDSSTQADGMIDSVKVVQDFEGYIDKSPKMGRDMGDIPIGKESSHYFMMKNIDTLDLKIDSIVGSTPDMRFNASWDSIWSRMIIGVEVFVTPQELGPFQKEFRMHFKNVRKPFRIRFIGNTVENGDEQK